MPATKTTPLKKTAEKPTAVKKRPAKAVPITKEALELEAAKPVLLPRTLAGCADRLYVVRDEKSLLTARVKKLEREEAALRDHLIENLPKSEAKGIEGEVARAKIDTKKVPSPKDWPKIHAYIKKTGDFDLLQKRLSTTRAQELWDSGKKIPGVEAFNAISVSVTKR